MKLVAEAEVNKIQRNKIPASNKSYNQYMLIKRRGVMTNVLAEAARNIKTVMELKSEPLTPKGELKLVLFLNFKNK